MNYFRSLLDTLRERATDVKNYITAFVFGETSTDDENIFYGPKTLKNFDDFNNMFRRMDRPHRTPDDTAQIVFETVNREHNRSKSLDAFIWLDSNYFFKIRRTINPRYVVEAYDSGVGNSEDEFDDEFEDDVSDIED